MSYCRFSPGCDVYVFNDISGGITIMTYSQGDYRETTRSAAIAQLERLRDMGLNVPSEVVEEIKADLAEVGETAGIEPEKGGK